MWIAWDAGGRAIDHDYGGYWIVILNLTPEAGLHNLLFRGGGELKNEVNV